MHITARSVSQPEGKGNGKLLAKTNMDSHKTRKAYSCNKQDLLGPEWKSELTSDATVTRDMRQLIRGYGPLWTYPLVNCFTVLFFGIQDKRLKINSHKKMRKTLKWCTELNSFLTFCSLYFVWSWESSRNYLRWPWWTAAHQAPTNRTTYFDEYRQLR